MVGIHLSIPRIFVRISSDPISIKVFKRKREKLKVQIVAVVLLVVKPGPLDSWKSIH
jgi:hypothetical protein